METNRQLQETTQKLYMAKQELEEKNKKLKVAEEKEKHQKEQLRSELDALKQLARPSAKVSAKSKKKTEPIAGKKITKSIAEDLTLRYIHLLETYVRIKDLDKEASLVDELCRKLLECGVTPKGIISLHLKAVSQIKTMGDLETKRVTFESRMVLLKVMTHYAMFLIKERADIYE